MALMDEIQSSGCCFKIGVVSGLLTVIAAADPVFSMRWTSDVKNCVIQGFKWWWTTTTAFAAAQMVSHALYKATAWTVSDSLATAIDLTLLGGNKITSKGSSLFAAGDVRIGSNVHIGPGTRTLPATPLIYDGAWSSGAGIYLPVATQADFSEDGYIILKRDEGIVLNNMVTMGAAGVIVLGVSVEWAEVPKNLMQ